MSEKIIAKIKDLNAIKPRKEWVALTKSQILGPEVVSKPQHVAAYGSVFSGVLTVFSNKRLAYAFSALLLAMIGAVGVGQYMIENNPNNQPVILGESSITSSLALYKLKSENLATAIKSDNGNKQVAVKELQDAAKTLAAAIAKDPASAKNVALELKHNAELAAITDGPDAKETTDLLYKAIDEQMIADLERATLTEEQEVVLMEIKAMFSAGDFSGALEKILLIK